MHLIHKLSVFEFRLLCAIALACLLHPFLPELQLVNLTSSISRGLGVQMSLRAFHFPENLRVSRKLCLLGSRLLANGVKFAQAHTAGHSDPPDDPFRRSRRLEGGWAVRR